MHQTHYKANTLKRCVSVIFSDYSLEQSYITLLQNICLSKKMKTHTLYIGHSESFQTEQCFGYRKCNNQQTKHLCNVI